MNEPDRIVLRWVAQTLAIRELVVIRGLRGGGSPWLLRADHHDVILRIGRPSDVAGFATEAAALQRAGQAGLPVPGLLAHDDGTAVGVPLVLTERLAGTSQIPLKPVRLRLHALGAVTARLHRLSLEPSATLPPRDRPIALEDFAALRWQHGSQLLDDAALAISRYQPTGTRTVFVHGDLWHGNTLWQPECLMGIIDWDCAGVGAPGVDLGSLRCDAALCYGMDAATEVLRGWEQEAGHPAKDMAYWDAVAALATPPDMGWFPDAFSEQGRPDLDRATLTAPRRDQFLRRAMRASSL